MTRTGEERSDVRHTWSLEGHLTTGAEIMIDV
jgi:hypothetical protein